MIPVPLALTVSGDGGPVAEGPLQPRQKTTSQLTSLAAVLSGCLMWDSTQGALVWSNGSSFQTVGAAIETNASNITAVATAKSAGSSTKVAAADHAHTPLPGGLMTVTSIKTGDYNAAAGELVLVDLSLSVGFTVTLPSASANQGRCVGIYTVGLNTRQLTVQGPDDGQGHSFVTWPGNNAISNRFEMFYAGKDKFGSPIWNRTAAYPDTSQLVDLSSTQTLSNKTLDASTTPAKVTFNNTNPSTAPGLIVQNIHLATSGAQTQNSPRIESVGSGYNGSIAKNLRWGTQVDVTPGATPKGAYAFYSSEDDGATWTRRFAIDQDGTITDPLAGDETIAAASTIAPSKRLVGLTANSGAVDIQTITPPAGLADGEVLRFVWFAGDPVRFVSGGNIIVGGPLDLPYQREVELVYDGAEFFPAPPPPESVAISVVDAAVNGVVTPENETGLSVTAGVQVRFTRAGLVIVGIHFYTARAASGTIRARLRNAAGTVVATLDKAVTGAGAYDALFATPYITSDSDLYKRFTVEVFETDGAGWSRTGDFPGSLFNYLMAPHVIYEQAAYTLAGDAALDTQTTSFNFMAEPIVR